MASLYPRGGMWWIKYRDPATGSIKRESTGYRVGIGAETRQAEALQAEKTLIERQSAARSNRVGRGAWDEWVEGYVHDPSNELARRTIERYLTFWRTLRKFLIEQNVPSPRNLTYSHCSGYFKWRAEPDIKNGKYNACKNTAIQELKFLRWIMREAVRRGYSQSNPAREMVLKKQPRKLFPEFTDDQLKKIYQAILTEPEPEKTCFLRSFAIALLQGVRLNETNVNPMRDVVFYDSGATVRFFQKGSRERVKPLHPQLEPLFKNLKAELRNETYPLARTQEGRLKWTSKWTKFFDRHGFKYEITNACFHSLRITVENVLRRAGIEQRVREFYLSHEHQRDDGEVNALYDRETIEEMRACHPHLERSWLVID